jgi:hypothetical protein
MKVITLVALHKVRRVEPRGQASYMTHGVEAGREQSTQWMVKYGSALMPLICRLNP